MMGQMMEPVVLHKAVEPGRTPAEALETERGRRKTEPLTSGPFSWISPRKRNGTGTRPGSTPTSPGNPPGGILSHGGRPAGGCRLRHGGAIAKAPSSASGKSASRWAFSADHPVALPEEGPSAS
jgi:hypothetical protein